MNYLFIIMLQDCSVDSVRLIISSVVVPEFQPSSKVCYYNYQSVTIATKEKFEVLVSKQPLLFTYNCFLLCYCYQHIETDTSAKKPDAADVPAELVDVSISTLDKLSATVSSSDLTMNFLSFEKDDDSNGHIDFITASSVSDT